MYELFLSSFSTWTLDLEAVDNTLPNSSKFWYVKMHTPQSLGRGFHVVGHTNVRVVSCSRVLAKHSWCASSRAGPWLDFFHNVASMYHGYWKAHSSRRRHMYLAIRRSEDVSTKCSHCTGAVLQATWSISMRWSCFLGWLIEWSNVAHYVHTINKHSHTLKRPYCRTCLITQVCTNVTCSILLSWVDK